nr:IS6 family transposase [Microvirga ossetica]
MTTTPNLYRGFRFPAEIINQAVWLYHCFSLSLREVELILAARGIRVSYGTIRAWSLRFGRRYAKALKRRRPQPVNRLGNIAPPLCECAQPADGAKQKSTTERSPSAPVVTLPT